MKNVFVVSSLAIALIGFSSLAFSQRPPSSPDPRALPPCSEVSGTPQPIRFSPPEDANCACRLPQDCAVSPCDRTPAARRLCRVSPAR